MKKRCIGFAVLLALCLSGCGTKRASQDFYAMDTFMNITAYGGRAEDAVTQCVTYINGLEREISRTKSGSDVSKLNAADGQPVALSQDSADILSQALTLARNTHGYFDPTIAGLSDLWQIGTDDQRIPKQNEIDAVCKTIGYDRVWLDGTQASLEAGMKLDLGGIGKGYAADHVVALLREAGVERAVISLGGNVYVMGQKEKGVNWTVGITDPDNASSYLGTLSVSDTSVVTSGDYERYFEQDGVRYCHIFDPETGYPAQSDLRSVTVVGSNSTQDDAYSTALFVMGYDKAMKFCAENGIQAVFVRSDHTVIATDGIRDAFTLTNTEYTDET